MTKQLLKKTNFNGPKLNLRSIAIRYSKPAFSALKIDSEELSLDFKSDIGTWAVFLPTADNYITMTDKQFSALWQLTN
jgi:hypothetical protein